ncbi:MAG: hypothetical protein LBO72_04075 [Helicobacteraceae bacterium]|jgi:hypothetical protein|nr:hypothetical protein [Helicobacteraceae bacterium]
MQKTRLKRGGLGVASFAVSAASLFVLAAMLIYERISEPLRADVFIYIALTALAALFLAIALGIGGVCQKNRKKTFAVLGLFLSIGALALGALTLFSI